MTLLIVEDVTFMRNNVKRILEKESLRILESESVESALIILQKENVDIIMLDLNLNPTAIDVGEKNGLRILEQIKNTNMKKPYTIVLSATINQDNMRKACQLGVEKFLSKPCKSEQILNSVQEAKRHILNYRD